MILTIFLINRDSVFPLSTVKFMGVNVSAPRDKRKHLVKMFFRNRCETNHFVRTFETQDLFILSFYFCSFRRTCWETTCSKCARPTCTTTGKYIFKYLGL